MNNFDVFVYGTLRKGGVNHHYLEDSICIQDNFWIQGYCLYDYQQWYPFMLKSSNKEWVKGEIYRVDESIMEQLNILEDIENQLYRSVYLDQYKCLTFLKYDEYVEGLTKIKEGDWLAYIRKINA